MEFQQSQIHLIPIQNIKGIMKALMLFCIEDIFKTTVGFLMRFYVCMKFTGNKVHNHRVVITVSYMTVCYLAERN